MEGLSQNWFISEPGRYFATVILWQLAIRIGHSFIRAFKQAHEADGALLTFVVMAWRNFRGFHRKWSNQSSDYWYTFILGSLELAAYPVLMSLNVWAVIGAWIGLKTIAQWSVWSNDRAVFNLFLIGNVAVLAVAFFVLKPFVVVQ